ncbi:MAG: DUF2254 domain-containing protein [Rhodanobacteraceae bacterium]
MHRLRLWLDTLRTSLWFVPTLIVLGAVVLANAMLALDVALPYGWWRGVKGLNHILDVNISGATAMLQMVGGSIITIAGVVFSITIAAVTLASGQYTSRVLRNFIRDRANQMVLGSFLGIFVYCVFILRSLSGLSAKGHPPALAMLMTLVLSFVGIALLIFFIHHITLSLQAQRVVADIAQDALPSIDRHFPSRFEPPQEETVGLSQPSAGQRIPVRSHCSGFITGIDYDDLVEWADACDGLVRVLRRAGRFVAEGEIIAQLQTATAPEQEGVDRVRKAWSFAAQRTLENDPGYALRQLVDVALKALSPGVNETTTGVMCVNWLGVLLLRMGSRRFPPRILTSGNRVRVLTHAPRLGDFIDLAFDQIRQNAAGNAAVLQRQLEVLLALADSPGAPLARQPILRQADAIEALMERSIPWEPDREPLRARLVTLRETLGAGAPPDAS